MIIYERGTYACIGLRERTPYWPDFGTTLHQDAQSVPNEPELCFLFRFQVLKRTLGDIMCDVSRLGSVQKWVTLQPNSEYNTYERCVEKTQLDVRSIANEIAREVSTGW